MKIIFATKGLEKSSGGSERVFTEICNEIVSNNKDLSVLTFDRHGYEPFYPLNSSIKKISLNHGGIFRHATIFSFFKSIYLLRKTIIKEKPDVIVAFMHSMFVPIALASIFFKVKIIASEHATIEYYNKKKLELCLIKLITPLLSKIVFLSEELAEKYPKLMQTKSFVISNPVKMDFAYKLSEPFEKEDVILSVGTFNKNKRHDLLIDAFMRISDKHPNWRLIILGDGELRSNLIKLINEKLMSDRIILPGVVKDVGAYYSKSNIFVLASMQESFGLSIAEAMLFECAPICFSSSCGAKELLHDNKNGLLIDDSVNDKVNSLSKALEKLICNPDLRTQYGKQARKYIAKNYEPNKIANRWKAFLNSNI